MGLASRIVLGEGEDIFTASGRFQVNGGPDDDILVVEYVEGGEHPSLAIMEGGTGDDTIIVKGGRARVKGGQNDDILISMEKTTDAVMRGGAGDDVFSLQGKYAAMGGAGEDVFYASLGHAVTISGGANDDQFFLSSAYTAEEQLKAHLAPPPRPAADGTIPAPPVFYAPEAGPRLVDGGGGKDAFYLNIFDWLVLHQDPAVLGGKAHWILSSALSELTVDADAKEDHLTIDLEYRGDDAGFYGTFFTESAGRGNYRNSQEDFARLIEQFQSEIATINLEHTTVLGNTVVDEYRSQGTDANDHIVGGSEIVGFVGDDVLEVRYGARLVRGDRGDDQILFYEPTPDQRLDGATQERPGKIIGGKDNDTVRFTAASTDTPIVTSARPAGVQIDLNTPADSPYYSAGSAGVRTVWGTTITASTR